MLKAISSHVFLRQRLHPGLLDALARSGAEAIEIYAARQHFDYFSAVARLDTANNLPNDELHNTTFVGNFGFAPDAKTDLRFILRRVATNSGEPNAFLLYGIPDALNQKDQDTLPPYDVLDAVLERLVDDIVASIP